MTRCLDCGQRLRSAGDFLISLNRLESLASHTRLALERRRAQALLEQLCLECFDLRRRRQT